MIPTVRIHTWGFSIIEVIATIIILVLGIVGTYGFISSGQKASLATEHRVIATNIAREGVEGFTNIRDTNWLKFSSDYDHCWATINYDAGCVGNAGHDLANGSYTLTMDNGILSLAGPITPSTTYSTYRDQFPVYYDTNGLISQTWSATNLCSHTAPASCRSIYTREILVSRPTADTIRIESIVTWADNTDSIPSRISIPITLTNWRKSVAVTDDSAKSPLPPATIPVFIPPAGPVITAPNICKGSIPTHASANATSESSGSTWARSPTAWICTFDCDTSYTWIPATISCIQTGPGGGTLNGACTGLPANAIYYGNVTSYSLINASNDLSLTASYNDPPIANTCQFKCNTGYGWDGAVCTTSINYCRFDSSNFDKCVYAQDCQGTIPPNALSNALSGQNTDSWTYSALPGSCTYTCLAGFTWDGSSCSAASHITCSMTITNQQNVVIPPQVTTLNYTILGAGGGGAGGIGGGGGGGWCTGIEDTNNTNVKVYANGGVGGDFGNPQASNGANGTKVTGKLTVSPWDTLNIIVGGGGGGGGSYDPLYTLQEGCWAGNGGGGGNGIPNSGLCKGGNGGKGNSTIKGWLGALGSGGGGGGATYQANLGQAGGSGRSGAGGIGGLSYFVDLDPQVAFIIHGGDIGLGGDGGCRGIYGTAGVAGGNANDGKGGVGGYYKNDAGARHSGGGGGNPWIATISISLVANSCPNGWN